MAGQGARGKEQGVRVPGSEPEGAVHGDRTHHRRRPRGLGLRVRVPGSEPECVVRGDRTHHRRRPRGASSQLTNRHSWRPCFDALALKTSRGKPARNIVSVLRFKRKHAWGILAQADRPVPELGFVPIIGHHVQVPHPPKTFAGPSPVVSLIAMESTFRLRPRHANSLLLAPSPLPRHAAPSTPCVAAARIRPVRD